LVVHVLSAGAHDQSAQADQQERLPTDLMTFWLLTFWPLTF
jgi:hypothetical protein